MCHRRRTRSLWLVCIAILALGCSDHPSEAKRFAKVRSGLTRQEVFELVGQPSSIAQRPFPKELQTGCGADAVEALIYATERRSTVVYLDAADKVLCKRLMGFFKYH